MRDGLRHQSPFSVSAHSIGHFGFYRLVPESDETAVVGLIADDARQAGSSLKAFLQERKLGPIEYQSAMVPMRKFEYTARVTEVRRKVSLIGDAAAQVKVTTVGGRGVTGRAGRG